jgi:hypothetical protein
MSKFVQIQGEKVVTLFSCAQDPAYWSDVVEVDDDDPRSMAFSTMAQAILTGGPVANLSLQALVDTSDQSTDQPS